MATIIVCDGGCGAQSPDYTVKRGGPHVANGWFHVRAGHKRAFERLNEHDDKLYCDACSPRIIAAMKPLPAAPGAGG